MISRESILASEDEALFQLLSSEIARRIGDPEPDDLDALLVAIRKLPRGLRAMASTYDLDVSMTLDDLGFHFANYPSVPLAMETSAGLRELGASDAADLVECALSVARPYWAFIKSPDFAATYANSPLEAALDPINVEFWRLYGPTSEREHSLLDLWPRYARADPDAVV